MRPRSTATSPRRCSMARKRASMREGPLAELFKATEAAQRQAGPIEPAGPDVPTVEHAPPEPPPARERKIRVLEPLPEPGPALHRAPRAESAAYLAVIRVVGVGGAGLNAVNRMIDAGISQVEFVSVNTDIQQLQTSDAPVKIHIGRELTEGLGSGSDPEIGRQA